MAVASSARRTIPKFLYGFDVFSNLPRRVQSELGLSETRLRTYSIDALLDILSAIHPDVSFAVWNFLRLGNSGYEIRVEKLNGSEHKQGDKIISDFLRSMEIPQGDTFVFNNGLNKLINQLMKSLIIRGACSAELILDDTYQATQIYPVDPGTIIFKHIDGRYIPTQGLGSKMIFLDTPRFFYEGLDCFIDDPRGVSPIVSAIQTVFFQMQVLLDLKAVIHNQGYPKYDIKIMEEVLLKRMPISIKNDERKKEEWMNTKLNEIVNLYNELEPDDAFVHYDSTEVNLPDAGKAMLDPEKILNVINEQMNMALKSLSTILGRRSQGNTETFAKLEIKLYLKGLETIQYVIANMLSRILTMVLNFQGQQGYVWVKFKPCEINTALEQEQMRQIQLLNIKFEYDMGWISHTEASLRATGHKPDLQSPRSATEPRNSDGSVPSGTLPDIPNAGVNDITSQ